MDQSSNPDFKEMVHRTNLGARLLNARQNWERLPASVNTAINRVTDLIKPPAPSDTLRQKLNRAADQFKGAIRHIVSEYITGQYSSNQRALAQLDSRDRTRANQIVHKQLTRSNGRINNARADDLISATVADIHDVWLECHTVTSRKRNHTPTPSPSSQGTTPVPVTIHNRFQPLQDQLTTKEVAEMGSGWETSLHVPTFIPL